MSLSAHRLTPLRQLAAAWNHWRGRQARFALAGEERMRLDATARDLGLAGPALMRISTYGPEAADLLRQRLAVLGRSGRDAAALGNGVWQDMQRACCECSEKDRCGRDLEIQPDDTAWRRYCPNADALQTIARGRPV